MRMRFLTVLMASSLAGFASTALAQDEIDPEGGEFGTTESEGEFGGEAEVGGDDMAPSGDGDGVEKPISVGLLLGYGISLEDGANPWGLGFGVRGGYNLDAIFLGARFVYYLGESQEASVFGMNFESSFNIWELGIEGGYDIDVGGVVVRPGLGLGLANLSVDAGGVSASETEFYLAPGVSALFDVSENIFLGAEARFKLVMADETVKGLILLANGGMRF
jgi:opacity protein-like surface antigen